MHPGRGAQDEVSDDDRDDNNSLLDRRAYLKLGAAAASAVALSGAAGSAGAATTWRGISFSTVLNAVDDLGMDPNGNEPIDDALDGAVADDTLIEFPPGDYLFTREHRFDRMTNFGIRGTGSDKSAVQIRPPRREGYEFVRFEYGTNILLENFTLDQRDTIPEWSAIVVDVDTGAELHDIEFAGFNPSDDPPEQPTTSRPQNPIRFHQQNSDGVSNITGIVKRGPSDMQPYPQGHTCLYFGTDVYGEVNVRDCYIANMSSHAMYGTQSPGTIRVENCTFENNNGVQLRIGGDNAVVRNCTVLIDIDNAHPDNIYPDGSIKYNSLGVGIWTSSQTDPPQGGGLIEDTEIIARSVPNFDGTRPWLIECGGSAGATTYRNVSIHSEADGHGLVKALDSSRVRLPSGFPSDQSVTLDGVTVTGNSSGSDPAVDILGRDATVKNCCIDVGGDRDGLGIREGANGTPTGTVSNTNINVAGTATRFGNASVETSGLTYTESCPLPGASDGGSDGSDSTDGSEGSGSDSDSGGSDGSDSTDGSGDSGGTSYDHTLRVVSDQGAPAFNYRVRVSGDAALVTSGEYAATPEQNGVGESVTANGDGTSTITGIVANGGGDSFRFNGEVLGGELGGPGTVTVDGSAVDLGNQSLSNSLRIEGSGEYASYSVTVDGTIAAVEETFNAGDSIEGSTATGGVAGGTDAYEYSGSVTDFTLDGQATVYRNGEQVDPATLAGDGSDSGSGSGSDSGSDSGGSDGSGSDSGPTYENLITVDGADSQSTYQFEVTGGIIENPNGGALEQGDTISGTTASGSVDGEVDSFRFSGDLVSLTLDGTADITFEDNDG